MANGAVLQLPFLAPGEAWLKRIRDTLHNSGESVASGSGGAARRLFAANGTAKIGRAHV